MWYEKSYRRHLCDIHIDDWDESFLSVLSPKEYVENLKKANVQSAMIYFQSHVGLCYFPTEVGRMHKALRGRENLIRRITELCHSEGITVTGYYSLIYNNTEFERHPEWRMVDADGRSLYGTNDIPSPVCAGDGKRVFRYGLCCPNNLEYRAFVKEQMREMAEYFTFEGMFFDMLFWPHVCACQSCRARWKTEVGGELPLREDWNDPLWLLHMQKRREWMGEFAHWATDEMKTLCPHVSVEHNVAYSALPDGIPSNGEEVISACDYAGGDLYRGLYGQSFACKFYRNITKHQPFEYMFTRAPNLGSHTQIKSLDTIRSAVFLTAAHHGATLVIDAINPTGSMDSRVYERIGQVFSESAAYEAYLTGEMIEDVGLYYSHKSKFEPHADGYSNYRGIDVMLETLIANHIPFGMTGSFHDLERYPVLVAPMLTDEDRDDVERLVKYVRDGGSLYFSGADCTDLFKAFFEVDVKGRTEEQITYLAPTETGKACFVDFSKEFPLSFGASAPILEARGDAEILATLTLPYTKPNEARFASIHSDPPGIHTDIPVMLYRKFGKGRVVWSVLPIEGISSDDHRDVVLSLLRMKLGLTPTVASDASRDVEITAFERENRLQINAVLLNNDQYARRVADFEISVRCDRTPRGVRIMPNGEEIGFAYDGETVSFRVRDFEIFRMYEIEFLSEK